MTPLRRACLWALVLALPAQWVAAKPEALEPLAEISDLAPTRRHQAMNGVVVQLLKQFHYRKSPLDDALSSQVLDAYLESLDPNRMYLLAEDIDEFEAYRHRLDNYLRSKNLDPAFHVFNVFQRRLTERTARLRQQLRQEFDFGVDESLDLDRDASPWPHSVAQQDEVWRRRVKHELLNLVLAGQELDEARETLERRYLGRQRRTAQTTADDVFQIYMSAVAQSYDPHTAYFSPRNTENFNIQMRLSLEGIGAVLRSEDEHTVVVELVPGGPADLSDELAPNDRIIGVGQGERDGMEDVVGWRLDDVVDLIRGPRGSVVRLQVIPAKAGNPSLVKTVRLVRDTIRLEEQAAQTELITVSREQRQYRIGVLRVPTFYVDFAAAQRGERNYRSTTRDVRRLLAELKAQDVDGVVVDLRRNGGGSLQEAIQMTGLFISSGPIVQVRNKGGKIEVERDPDPDIVYEGPLAVLVDRFSASASEIFAAAIQDYGRGVVIGEPTFGKGTVQTLVDLDRVARRSGEAMGQLKLTVAKFYRVDGGSTQHRGVEPDIAFPATFGPDEVGERAHDRALPWDEIRPVGHRDASGLGALIPKLRSRHLTRMLGDPGLRRLAQGIEEARRERQRTEVTLLKSRREAELARAEARVRERENLRRSELGLEPIAEGEAVPDDTEEQDLLLTESAHIVADLIALGGGREGGGVLVVTGS